MTSNRTILVVLLGIVISAVISYLVINFWPQSSPQIAVERFAISPIIKQGQPVKIRVTVSRTKACPTTVHTWFVDQSGNVVANLITPSPFSNLVGIGSQIIDSSTDNLPPGRYKIVAQGIIDCGTQGIFVAPNPDLDIEIVPP